jgi:hypothetical protein
VDDVAAIQCSSDLIGSSRVESLVAAMLSLYFIKSIAKLSSWLGLNLMNIALDSFFL